MTQLKTLKELNFRESPQLGISFEPIRKENNQSEEWINHQQLRQEAIKWLKELKKEFVASANEMEARTKFIEQNIKVTHYTDDIITELQMGCLRAEGSINFIKDFFNIEESELK